MYLTVKGLILKVTNYNDFDAYVNVLTDSHGKLTLKARGIRRRNSKLIAACQLLSYSEFTLFECRGVYTINEARPIELFHNLRKDLLKLSLGSYLVQVAELLGLEDCPNPELLSLTLNSLYALSTLNVREALIKSVFEMRSACIAGYAPDLTVCHRCGSSNPDRFDVLSGRLECSACRDWESDGLRMPISPGALDTMRYVCSCHPKNVYSFSVSPETETNLSQLTELYLTTQLEHGFSTLDFYKSLLME